jgi:hypothetical protein
MHATPNNSILLTVEPSDNEAGKNVGDSKNRSILVTIKDDNGLGISVGVRVTLLDRTGGPLL